MKSPDPVAFGPFELDCARRVLLHRGNPVAAGSRAMDVLCELVCANGDLVAKDTLMARVWPDTVVTENSLQVQVAALRRLFSAQGGDREWLQTVPGRGYRFIAPLRPLGDGKRPAAAGESIDSAVHFVRAKDGVHLAAAASGEGPDVLRAGLWMTHLEHEWATHVWGPLNTRLSQQVRLIRYDQRGTGLSDREVPPLDFGTSVSDFEEVAQRFAPGRLALLGISQGAATAIEFAARHPGRVSCMVLLGGYARGWRLRGEPETVQRGEAFQLLALQGWGKENPAFRQLFTSLGWPDASRAEMDAMNELQRVSASAQVASQIVALTGGIDVSQRLRHVRVPTLVMHSERDAWVPVALGRELATGIEGARFLALDSTSHVVQPSEPAWATCVAALLAFIGQHAGRGA